MYVCVGMLLLTSCEGIFDTIYDHEEEASEGEFYVDASSWTDWYYVDLHAMTDSTYVPQFDPYPIPTDSIGPDQWDGETGIHTYWYDVYGQGTSHSEYVSDYHTATQPEPEQWDIALHRDNVRTNGGAVFETQYTGMDQLPPTSEAFWNETFTPDTYCDADVWTISDRMMTGYVGNQRIPINPVLSTWLSLEIQIPGKVPPEFTHNTHVFILRLADGTYAALRLADYVRGDVKCRMTVEWRYPY